MCRPVPRRRGDPQDERVPSCSEQTFRVLQDLRGARKKSGRQQRSSEPGDSLQPPTPLHLPNSAKDSQPSATPAPRPVPCHLESHGAGTQKDTSRDPNLGPRHPTACQQHNAGPLGRRNGREPLQNASPFGRCSVPDCSAGDSDARVLPTMPPAAKAAGSCLTAPTAPSAAPRLVCQAALAVDPDQARASPHPTAS